MCCRCSAEETQGKGLLLNYYFRKTLDDDQINYIFNEKEMLAFVYVFDEFRTYLVGTKVIVHTDHLTTKYLSIRKM